MHFQQRLTARPRVTLLKGLPFRALACLGVAAACLAGPALAEDEDWRGALRQQLQSQYGCRLGRFVFERELPLGGDTSREGRIECADGREIDYTQRNILLKFELRLCAPTVC